MELKRVVVTGLGAITPVGNNVPEFWENHKAIAAGELVTGYSLPEDVTLIYKAPYFSQESIFSLPMADTNIPNTQQSLAEYYYDGKIMLIDTKSGIMSKPDYSLATDKRIIAFKGEKDLLMKFTDAKTKLQWVPIFRYAETLLDLAECYANKAGVMINFQGFAYAFAIIICQLKEYCFSGRSSEEYYNPFVLEYVSFYYTLKI